MIYRSKTSVLYFPYNNLTVASDALVTWAWDACCLNEPLNLAVAKYSFLRHQPPFEPVET